MRSTSVTGTATPIEILAAGLRPVFEATDGNGDVEGKFETEDILKDATAGGVKIPDEVPLAVDAGGPVVIVTVKIALREVEVVELARGKSTMCTPLLSLKRLEPEQQSVEPLVLLAQQYKPLPHDETPIP